MADGASLHRPLLLGHRGTRARRSIPENTIASFDQALADGCDGFEFDVRLSADGAAVICHDAQFEGIEIAKASALQLAHLPSLEDVLARYQDRAFLDIELKVNGIEKSAVSLLRKYPPRRGYVMSSFLPEVLRTIYAEDSATHLGLICETSDELQCWTQLPVESVILQHSLADRAWIGRLKSAARKVLVWTVNNPTDMLRFRECEVDGIISDDTMALCKTLAR